MIRFLKKGSIGGKEIAFALSLSILGGCFPVHLNYWEPHATGGKPIRRDCAGRVGPQDAVELEREGMRVSVFIREKNAMGSILELSLRIPPQVTVTIPSRKLLLKNRKEETGLSFDPLEVWSYDRDPKRQFKLVEDWSVFAGESYRIYYILFALPQELDDSFAVVLPVMVVKDAEIAWPPITFSRASGWYVYPLNC